MCPPRLNRSVGRLQSKMLPAHTCGRVLGLRAPAGAEDAVARKEERLFKLRGTRPSNLGVKDGRLAACSSSPNCVSSQADDRQHGISPLAFRGDAVTAMEKLAGVVAAIPRTQVMQSRSDYLYVEFATPLGFVDDVEFYCDGKAIQVRSASRLGYSDLGVNRKRIEAIRAAFRDP